MASLPFGGAEASENNQRHEDNFYRRGVYETVRKNSSDIQKKKETEDVQIGRYADKQADTIERKIEDKQNSNLPDLGLSSVFSILPSASDVNPIDEQQPLKPKKKKKRGRGI